VSVYGLTLAGDARVLYAATHGRGIYRLKLPGFREGGGAGGAPAPGPGTGTPAPKKLTLKFVAAALHGRKHRYIRVRLVASQPVRLRARIRNERGKRVGRRTLRIPANRRVAFRVLVKRKTKIHHRRRWRLQVRATDATGQVATASRRFRI